MLSFLPALLLPLTTQVAAASFSDLGIPPSSATVDVKAFNAVASVTSQASTLVFPALPDRRALGLNVYSFLIQHNNDRIMFDIGFRKDVQNLAPFWTNLISSGVIHVDIEEDIPTQLQKGNISLSSISAVFWRYGVSLFGETVLTPSQVTRMPTTLATCPCGPILRTWSSERQQTQELILPLRMHLFSTLTLRKISRLSIPFADSL